jgi:hypothetical protein
MAVLAEGSEPAGEPQQAGGDWGDDEPGPPRDRRAALLVLAVAIIVSTVLCCVAISHLHLLFLPIKPSWLV